MDKFKAIEVFTKVANHGGFAAAGRDLNMSPPAVTRTISMLEDQVGVRLFVRTTRSVMLTESGQRFYEDTKRILLDLEEAEHAALGSYSEPKGQLNITASVLFGRMFMTPILAEFLDIYPNIAARALYVDRVVNLIDEGIDIGVRIGNLPDSSLMATRCGSVRQIVFASPDYLAKYGEPQNPEDLRKHILINSSALNAPEIWQFRHGGKQQDIRITPRVSMNTNDALIEMVLAGQGIGRLLSYQVASHIDEGRLTTVLIEHEPNSVPIHLVHQEGRMVSAKVRTFVDFATSKLRESHYLM